MSLHEKTGEMEMKQHLKRLINGHEYMTQKNIQLHNLENNLICQKECIINIWEGTDF